MLSYLLYWEIPFLEAFWSAGVDLLFYKPPVLISQKVYPLESVPGRDVAPGSTESSQVKFRLSSTWDVFAAKSRSGGKFDHVVLQVLEVSHRLSSFAFSAPRCNTSATLQANKSRL